MGTLADVGNGTPDRRYQPIRRQVAEAALKVAIELVKANNRKYALLIDFAVWAASKAIGRLDKKQIKALVAKVVAEQRRIG